MIIFLLLGAVFIWHLLQVQRAMRVEHQQIMKLMQRIAAKDVGNGTGTSSPAVRESREVSGLALGRQVSGLPPEGSQARGNPVEGGRGREGVSGPPPLPPPSSPAAEAELGAPQGDVHATQRPGVASKAPKTGVASKAPKHPPPSTSALPSSTSADSSPGAPHENAAPLLLPDGPPGPSPLPPSSAVPAPPPLRRPRCLVKVSGMAPTLPLPSAVPAPPDKAAHVLARVLLSLVVESPDVTPAAAETAHKRAPTLPLPSVVPAPPLPRRPPRNYRLTSARSCARSHTAKEKEKVRGRRLRWRTRRLRNPLRPHTTPPAHLRPAGALA